MNMQNLGIISSTNQTTIRNPRTVLFTESSGKINVSTVPASLSMALEFVQLPARFSFHNGQELLAHFSFSQWAGGTNMAIFLFEMGVSYHGQFFSRNPEQGGLVPMG